MSSFTLAMFRDSMHRLAKFTSYLNNDLTIKFWA